MIKAVIFDWVNTLYTYDSGLYPFAKQVLDYLKPKYKIGLVTLAAPGVEHRKLEIIQSGLEKYFDAVVIEEQKGKLQFESVIGQLGVNPSECIVVDDQPYNIQTAKDLGCQVLHVTSTKTAEELLNIL